MTDSARSRGFTLIEAMVIVATIGLLAALGVATWQRASGEAPPHNAARDMVEAMDRARALAVERKNDVWVIVYPGFNKGAKTSNAGRGAYFVFEDTGHDFNAPTGSPPSIYYRSGVGREFDPVARTFEGPNGKVLEAVYLDDYGGKIRFRLPSSKIEMGQSEAPFAGLEITAACTFCTAGLRGAIVFSPDNSIRFVDASGDPIQADGGHALVLISDRNKHTSVVAISASQFGAYRK